MAASAIWRGLWRHLFDNHAISTQRVRDFLFREAPAESKDIDSDSAGGLSYATCSEGLTIRNEAPWVARIIDTQPALTPWRASMVLNPVFSQQHSGEIVAIRDAQQDRRTAITLSAELFELTSRAVAGGRDLDLVFSKDAFLDRKYAGSIEGLIMKRPSSKATRRHLRTRLSSNQVPTFSSTWH